MIARPRYAWAMAGNIIDNQISIDVDIEMLERIKSILRCTINDMAQSCQYTDLAEVLEDYLKIEQLSVLYYQKKEEQKKKEQKEEDQQDAVLSETETAEQ